MRWLAVLVLGVASLASISEAHACTCLKQTVAEGVASAHAVFSGKVTSIKPNTKTEFGGLEVALQVDRVWKGDPQREIKVRTASSGAVCGYPFRVGSDYLVYAVKDEADPLRVSLCSRTKPLAEAKEDLAQLGDPIRRFDEPGVREKNAQAAANTKDNCSITPGPPSSTGFGLLALALAGLAIAMRRLA